MANKIVQTLQSERGSAIYCTIVRHPLPIIEGRFTIEAHGFKELSFVIEEGIPVLYEVAITSEEDYKPWPHHYWWICTGSPMPDQLRADSFVGTMPFPDRPALHLFRDWSD